MPPIHRRPPIMTGAVWGSRGCLMPTVLAAVFVALVVGKAVAP